MMQPQFQELCRVNIEKNLDLVFSRRADGLISVAQQRFTEIRGRRQGIWIKNALITDNKGIAEAANGFMACLDRLVEDEVNGRNSHQKTHLRPAMGTEQDR